MVRTFILCATLTLCTSSAVAQTYSSLGEFSPYHCLYLPNGKNQIATKKKNGSYKSTSFKNAKENVRARTAAAVKRAKQLTLIVKELSKQRASGAVIATLKERDIRQIKGFLKAGADGVESDLSYTEELTLLIAKLENVLTGVQADASLAGFEMEALLACQRKDPPPVRSIDVQYALMYVLKQKRTPPALDEYYAEVWVYVKDKASLFSNSHTALCVYKPGGGVYRVGMVWDICGTADVNYSYPSTHPFATSGACAALLARNEKNQMLELGTVIERKYTNAFATNDSQAKKYLADAMAEWGTSVPAARPHYTKAKGTYCP